MANMTLKEIESEIKHLKELVAENLKAHDYLEIWKLQSLYSHLYHIGKTSEIPSLFAQKTPGVALEIEDSGVYEGIESVRRFWMNVLSENSRLIAGFLAVHMTVNPVIEINKARDQAKGVWHSHGYASLMKNSQLTPFLCLGKYDIEYAKEEGQWKFLKLFYRQTFLSPLDKGWVQEPVAASLAASPDNVPDKVTSYHMPYSPWRINIMQPPPPKPYDD